MNNANFDLFDDDTRDDDRRLNASISEASDFIVDIREYDVPYHVRVMIDKGMCHRIPEEIRITDMFQASGWENGTLWKQSMALRR